MGYEVIQRPENNSYAIWSTFRGKYVAEDLKSPGDVARFMVSKLFGDSLQYASPEQTTKMFNKWYEAALNAPKTSEVPTLTFSPEEVMRAANRTNKIPLGYEKRADICKYLHNAVKKETEDITAYEDLKDAMYSLEPNISSRKAINNILAAPAATTLYRKVDELIAAQRKVADSLRYIQENFC